MTSPCRTLSAALLLTSLCSAANMADHLVAVHHSTIHLSFPVLRGEDIQGSGICLNRKCSVVATAYHVQMLAGRANLSVASGRTVKVLSLANDNDTNKSDIPVEKSHRVLSYNIANDVSFVYTKKPVAHKSGATYCYKSYVGQKVRVAGYNHNGFNTKEAHIIGVNVPLIIGPARMNDNLILDTYYGSGNQRQRRAG